MCALQHDDPTCIGGMGMETISKRAREIRAEGEIGFNFVGLCQPQVVLGVPPQHASGGA